MHSWPTIAVDTHIDRVSNRTKFAMGKNVGEVEKSVRKLYLLSLKSTCTTGLFYMAVMCVPLVSLSLVLASLKIGVSLKTRLISPYY